MSNSVIEKTADLISESAQHASRAARAAADAVIQDGVGVAKRAAKQGGDAAEEFLNDTHDRLQRHLALTTAATFAMGVATGLLLGWRARRR